MMNALIRILLLRAIASAALAGEGVIPFDDVFVSVNTSLSVEGRMSGDRLSVSVRLSRTAGHPQGSTSIDVLCFSFPTGKRELHEDDLKAFFEACEAASKGIQYENETSILTEKGHLRTAFDTFEKDGENLIRVRRAGKEVFLKLDEAAKLATSLHEARLGKSWFDKLLRSDELPIPSLVARPPQSHGYHLSSKVGSVIGKGVRHELALTSLPIGPKTSYRPERFLRFSSDGGREIGVGGRWTEDVIIKIVSALQAIEMGNEYAFNSPGDDGFKFAVVADAEAKRAELTLYPNDFFKSQFVERGSFGIDQLKALRHLGEGYEAKATWFKRHEHLFFSPAAKQ